MSTDPKALAEWLFDNFDHDPNAKPTDPYWLRKARSLLDSGILGESAQAADIGPAGALPVALADIAVERERQKSVEGWTPLHDDELDNGSLARAASCYALSGSQILYEPAPPYFMWPWAARYWKPKNPRRDLIRAGALIVAEIERLDRAARAAQPRAAAPHALEKVSTDV